MAVVKVEAIGPSVISTGGPQLAPGVFVIITLGSSSLGRTPHNQTLPLSTEVIVEANDIRAIWDSNSSEWVAKIPTGTLLAVNIGGTLQIAETAQPIQVTGPTISILDLES